MVNYQLGKIYKIVGSGLVYIGSTCEPTLARRLAGHVKDYKGYLKGYSKYVSSFKILEHGNYEIVLIENCPCNNKDELHQKEAYFKQTTECVNINNPFGLDVEKYKASNKIYNASRVMEKKIWYDNNKHTQKYIESSHKKCKKYYDKMKVIINMKRSYRRRSKRINNKIRAGLELIHQIDRLKHKFQKV